MRGSSVAGGLGPPLPLRPSSRTGVWIVQLYYFFHFVSTVFLLFFVCSCICLFVYLSLGFILSRVCGALRVLFLSDLAF